GQTGPVATSSVTIGAPAAPPGATYYVAPTGADGAAGTAAAPWQTLQRAADAVQAGDTVRVLAGSYAGFTLRTSGTMGAPITFQAAGAVTITSPVPVTGDGIDLAGASYVTLAGFAVTGMPNTGIAVTNATGDVLRANAVSNSGGSGIALGGLVTGALVDAN